MGPRLHQKYWKAREKFDDFGVEPLEVVESTPNSPAGLWSLNQIRDVSGAKERLLLNFGVRPYFDVNFFFLLVNAPVNARNRLFQKELMIYII